MKISLLSLLVLSFLVSACSNENTLSQDSKFINCTSYDLSACPDECRICPPCEVCSSVRCDFKEECEKRGFSKEWSRSINP